MKFWLRFCWKCCVFCVDNRFPRHSVNHKNEYLTFDEGATHCITCIISKSGKNLALFLPKQKQYFV